MNMLVSLMRAMKPKMLDSFKDYNAQKEFLAKVKESKSITVVLTSNSNIINKPHNKKINQLLKNDSHIIVYNFCGKGIIKL